MFWMSHFSDAANYPFSVALLIVMILAAIEGVGMLIGAGIFSFLDGLLPDIDIDPGFDVPDLETPSITGQALTWLRIGKVPMIITLIVFMVAFGLIGLTVQGVMRSVFGFPLPALIACVPALILSLPVVSVGNTVLGAIMPRDETSAVSQNSLIGKMATITTGEAKRNSPAQGKVKDEYDQTHYIMIEPDMDKDSFAMNDSVLLVRRENATYYAITCDSEGLKG